PAYTPGSPNPVIGGSTATGVTIHNVVSVVPAAPTVSVTGISNNFGAVCPASVTLVGGTGTIDCTGGSVASGVSRTITFTATPQRIGTLSNATSITAANEFDPVAANNTANVSDRADNTPVCAGACQIINPVDAATGNLVLAGPQAATVQFSNVTTQGSTTMVVSAQPGACQVIDNPVLPALTAFVNNSTHVPFHGNVAY